MGCQPPVAGGRDVEPLAGRAAGFSPEAARAYARMTAATVDGPELPADPIRGDVALLDHIKRLNGL